MKLNIKFPRNLISDQLILQEGIPCICKISTSFEIEFRAPIPEAAGVVSGWDRELIEERVPAGAGGRYTHYAFGMITLRKEGSDSFQIVDLSFFDESLGWCPILQNCEYTVPKKIWDEE